MHVSMKVVGMFVIPGSLALAGCASGGPDGAMDEVTPLERSQGGTEIAAQATPIPASQGQLGASQAAGIPSSCGLQGYGAPGYQAPNFPAPSYPAPTYAPPSYGPPTYEAPTYTSPTYQQGSEVPGYQAPSYTAPNYPAPSFAGPDYQAPVYMAPTFAAPVYKAPAYVEEGPMLPAEGGPACTVIINPAGTMAQGGGFYGTGGVKQP
jgi:hypothetical protein